MQTIPGSTPSNGRTEFTYIEISGTMAFIVEGIKFIDGRKVMHIRVAGNFRDALIAHKELCDESGGLYLFARLNGLTESPPILGQVCKAIGSDAESEVFITLHDGTSYVVEAPKNDGSERVKPAKELYVLNAD